MNQEELESINKDLSGVYDELYFAMSQYKNGKNKKIKEDAQRTIDMLISRTRNILMQNPEVWDLVEFKDEFFSFQWFEGDLKKLLMRLNELINI